MNKITNPDDLAFIEEIKARDEQELDNVISINGKNAKKDFDPEKLDAEMKRFNELHRMKSEVDRFSITEKYNRIQFLKDQAQRATNISLTKIDSEKSEKLKAANIKNFSDFLAPKIFIGKSFNGIVPFTAQQLILIGAKTGGSKTTISANIAWSIVRQLDSVTGKNLKVLIISNEESELDILNRLACLCKLEETPSEEQDWDYSNRSGFKPNQTDMLNSFIDRFRQTGLVTVIDPDFNDVQEFTSCVENVFAVLDKLLETPGSVDCVIIDYYQNITRSRERPADDQYRAQSAFVSRLNYYKDRIGCPIVVMAQMNEFKKDLSWKERIVGTKSIAQPATFVMEVIPNTSSFTSNWIIHKARYGQICKVVTGFRFGRIVPLDQDFLSWAEPHIARRNAQSSETKQIVNELKQITKKDEESA